MPAVSGIPDKPMTEDDRFNLDNAQSAQPITKAQLADFFQALMQKLDSDTGVSDTDFESIFTP